MTWTCPHCGCEEVCWNPRLYSEAELRRLRGPRLPGGGRAILRTPTGWALDRQVACPRCRRSFYPGDALMDGIVSDRPGRSGSAAGSPRSRGGSRRPAGPTALPG